MGKIRLWLSGFAWGAMLGVVASVVMGIAVFRPDIWEKLSYERIERALTRKTQSTLDTSAPPPASAPAASGTVLFANTRTAPALEQNYAPPHAFSPDDVLVIKGRNASNDFVEVDLRIDDSASKDWGSRFGGVKTVPPGPFEWVVPFKGLTDQNRREMDINAITRIILFSPENLPAAQIASVTLERRPQPAAAAAGSAPGAAPARANAALFTDASTSPALEQNYAPPRAFGPDDALVIKGSNPTGSAIEVDLRIDDSASKDWGSRFGMAKSVPPGPFEWIVPFKGLADQNKREMDIKAITRIILFSPENQPAAQIASASIENRPGAGDTTGSTGGAANEAKMGQSWLKGARTTAEQEFYPPMSFAQDQEVVVTGTNTDSKPITLYLRIDDVNSKNWNSRVNATVTVPPGPFTFRSPVSSWVTPSKARLDRTRVARFVISLGDGEGPIRLGDVHVAGGSPLPKDALGLRFGPADVSVPGFETVTRNDPRLSPAGRDLVRTQNDPLLSSGLNGVRTITVPWTKSDTATVSLWTEDQGEWEYFPHSLHRTFIINGQVALKEDYRPDEWVEKVFHRGLWKEAMIDGDPWEVYASRRAGLVTATVPVIDGKITVQISSDQPPNDGYIAAMVIAPGASTAAAEAVEAWRRGRYMERWPVVDKPVDPKLAQGTTLRVLPYGAPRSQHPFWDPNLPTQTRLKALRGQMVSIDFLAFSDQSDANPDVAMKLPEGVTGEVRWGKWTYMRRGGGENSLSITSDVLEGDLSRLRIAAGIPRRMNITFTVPETASGTLPVVLAMNIGGASVEARADVEVAPVTLPATATPVGYYMAAPNPDFWFPPKPATADRLMACDLKALRRFGLTGLSPDLVTPTADQRARYLEQTRLAKDAGFSPPFFDYVSVKLLADKVGVQAMGENIGATEAALTAAGLPLPLWSIADEPQNLQSPMMDLKRLRDAIRVYAPRAKIAGQLNDIKDKPFLPFFDTVLVNTGFGVSARDFADLKAQGITPWLYNMPDIEAAAGFLLWRVGAEGYIQWHARAATADPSDPTDGREPDFMFLPLTADRCQSVPTVDAMVVATGDGITDLRLLQWLDGRAASDPKAKALRDEIFAAIPGDWVGFEKQKPNLPALRRKLIDYAGATAAP
ncbi:hypothetical protein [Azorhizobium caulinodans]|uniref:hypothetical protein n=1 Tax=Azorhizobium caulinodans TaxID=7 RepID=UPI002FBD40EE